MAKITQNERSFITDLTSISLLEHERVKDC